MVKISSYLKITCKVSLPTSHPLLLHFMLHLCFWWDERNLVYWIWCEKEEEDRAPGVLVYPGGWNLNVTAIHFWIEFYLQSSTGQNKFIDQVICFVWFVCFKKSACLVGALFIIELREAFKNKEFLAIKANVWPILVVHMQSNFYFEDICR